MSTNHLHRLVRGDYKIKITTAAYIETVTHGIIKSDDLMKLKDEVDKQKIR